jgi:hypothetical protein
LRYTGVDEERPKFYAGERIYELVSIGQAAGIIAQSALLLSGKSGETSIEEFSSFDMYQNSSDANEEALG